MSSEEPPPMYDDMDFAQRNESEHYPSPAELDGEVASHTGTVPGPLGERQHTHTELRHPDSINVLDVTKLEPVTDEVEIGGINSHNYLSPNPDGTGSANPDNTEENKSGTPVGLGQRMPSLSLSNRKVSDDISELRRASRRKWWSPTRCLDWCMHKSIFGKLLVMVLTWTTVIDYAKDIYVCVNLERLHEDHWFIITIVIMYLSLRLMLMLKVTDDTPTIKRLGIFYLPGSVLADFRLDKWSDLAVFLMWELMITITTPFMPFYLVYLATKKSISLFCGENFENPHLFAYAIVECVFETLPQLAVQAYLYTREKTSDHGEEDIEPWVFGVAAVVSVIVLIKIPLIMWWNRRIVYKLQFKRHHNCEVMAAAFHPFQDIVATGSWDNTCLINHLVIDTLKSKRVLNHKYDINSISWSPNGDLLVIGGLGVEIWDWRSRKSLYRFPKQYTRDQLRRRKRIRTNEVREVVWSPDNESIIWCEGKHVYIYDWRNQCERQKIRAMEGERLGDVMSVDVSPNGKYVACGLYASLIKIFNTSNKDLVRILEGHTQAVNCVKFCREGRLIVSGSSDYSVRIWDVVSGAQIKQLDAHDSDVTCVAVDYSNRFIASGGRDSRVYLSYINHPDENTITPNKPLRHKNSTSTPKKGGKRGSISGMLHKKKEASAAHHLSSHAQLHDESGQKKKDKSKDSHHTAGGSGDMVLVGKPNDCIKEMVLLENWDPIECERDVGCVDFSPYGDFMVVGAEDNEIRIAKLPPQFEMAEVNKGGQNSEAIKARRHVGSGDFDRS